MPSREGPVEGCEAAAVDPRRRLLSFDRVRIAPDRIAFDTPGMALMLNGVEQGYINDRVAALPASEDVTDALVEAGEIRALGARPDATPWPVRLGDAYGPLAALRPGSLATSDTHATTLDGAGALGNLIDPITGRPATTRRRVSFFAPEAATADALSTAAPLMTESGVARLMRDLGGRLEETPDGRS
jgi:thiamine biosynthesis lipoprotein